MNNIDIEMESSNKTSVQNKPKTEEELYIQYKKLQKEYELYEIQENYIKEEIKNLQQQHKIAKQEIKTVLGTPLTIGTFNEMIDENYALASAGHYGQYCVRVISTLNREDLKMGCSVAMHRSTKSIVDVLPSDADSSVQMKRVDQKPDVTYQDIGGLDVQKQEIKEAVELPLTHPELYQQIGIDPPKGVLLYGPPGTGKTMLAKAVANQTTAAFFRVCGSEFVQKYLGEGPKKVRDIFRLAKEHAPSIVFIDEIDSVGYKRFDSSYGGDREAQRILVELLTQMDGFDQNTNVKVIMATNRPDTLDPALLRPGRLDRKIEFPHPDRRQKRLIFQVITNKMNLAEDVDLEDYINRPEKISAADIASICSSAGLFAVRSNRYVVTGADFEKAYKDVISKREKSFSFYS